MYSVEKHDFVTKLVCSSKRCRHTHTYTHTLSTRDENKTIDAQSFSNCRSQKVLRGYTGFWKNMGGSSFSCFIEFLWPNFSKSFEGEHGVPPPPLSSPPPVCTYEWDWIVLNIVNLHTSHIWNVFFHPKYFE